MTRRLVQLLASSVTFRSRGLTLEMPVHTVKHPDHMPAERAKAIYNYAMGTPNKWVIYCALHCSDDFGKCWIYWQEETTLQACSAEVMHIIQEDIFRELLADANARFIDAFETTFRVTS